MRHTAIVGAVCTLVWVGCGQDVDLGGSANAAQPLSADCEPCVFADDCHAGAVCGLYSGDAYCATECPKGNECASGQTCVSVATTVGGAVMACLPSSGKCPAAPPPSSADGGVVTKCGVLVGPTVSATCKSCKVGVGDCQANGCYGGWWCKTTTSECVRPPKC